MFKQIKNYGGGTYYINESGIVMNKNGHVMRSAKSDNGYLRTSLEDPITHKRKNLSIHRLVAETFIPNPDNLPVVMHKDNDSLNNHVSNLKWGTVSENTKQAYEDGRAVSPNKGVHRTNKYQVYNEELNDYITCDCRTDVAELIQYAEISLKNMVGNDREIALGPYKGYKIRRKKEMCKIKTKKKKYIKTFNDYPLAKE